MHRKGLGSFSTQTTETYSERQAKKGRPVSPHATIYAFPVTAISSITNRVTGVALSAGLFGIGAYSLIGGDAGLLMNSMVYICASRLYYNFITQ